MFLPKSRRKIAFVLLALAVLNALEMPLAYALTSGPSQPEVQSFEPAGTTEMVDVFSGDFTYNIPLFELPGPNGGYPFNLAYHAGIGMEQESSWVGLGWNLNPGAINRQMRGLPDDFKGDYVVSKRSVKPSVTAGVAAGINVKLFGGDAMKAAIGFSVYNNNYRGVGYSIDGSLGFAPTTASKATGGLGLGISLDSQEGVSLSPSLSLDTKGETQNLSQQLGVGYNSRQGLKNLTYSASTGKDSPKEVLKSSYSLSLFNPGFTPQVGMPYNNTNLSGEVRAGAAWWGAFGSPYVRGFYSEQRLANDKKRMPTPAYGYLNYQDATQKWALMDFSREQDGMVRKESPNLPIPSLTYDIYSLTGQGMAAMYRPMRTDHGVIHDPAVESGTVGGSIGGDVGPALSHAAVNLSVNHGKATSGAWTEDNQIGPLMQFQRQAADDPYEPWYFKVHGESTAQPVAPTAATGGEAPVRVQLGAGGLAPALQTLENSTWSSTAPNVGTINRERAPRGEMITPFTNAQLLKGGEEMNPLFKVFYQEGALDTELKFSRTSINRPHHTAGFTALNASGLRYTYALPVYNHYQEEVQHSARKPADGSGRAMTGNGGNGDPSYEYDGTDKYLNKTEMPPFAHSYLLTSIVGSDYVDVTGNGVTPDDLGYWVKFTYRRVATATNPFKWRAPFSKSLYSEGLLTDRQDDRGSYVYGEKEIWYLSRAETKSHIATFRTEERQDGQGVVSALQDTDQSDKKLHVLKEIRLYTRTGGTNVPLKVVKFTHNYSLCKDVPNAPAGTGKLTLEEVWFEYGNSQRGKLNPYRFAYHPHNPNYNVDAQDRWGTYKRYPDGDPLFNKEFPYAEQNPALKTEVDQHAAAWSLTEINLPSGGKIKVDYESDDYAYVQQRPAMQMMPLVDPYSSPAATLPAEFDLQYENRKIRFPLETPLAANANPDGQKEVLKYLDADRKQLYFKIKINLRRSSENYKEYISGYADIDFKAPMGLEQDATGKYAYGYFHLAAEKGFHPFSLRAWQHLRTNQPELLSFGKSIEALADGQARLHTIKSIVMLLPMVRDVFGDFNNKCKGKEWGKEIVATRSWIRLNSPDGVKYGGGLRVKQVTLFDQWQHDAEGVYGQTYDYTKEENGRTISSGVATYEPLTGGEENALRHARKFTQAVPLASNNNLFTELPVNEGYYPGAGVGYSKVTVKSLASASLAGEEVKNTTLADGKKLFPQGSDVSYGTSGVTVHEFYTARDFPVIVDETDKVNRPSKVFIPVPLLGSLVTSRLTASQGYSITTNDMHGKPRQTSVYRQDPKGKMEPKPISWVRYNYKQQGRVYDGKKVATLLNTFKEVDEHTIGTATEAELASTAVKKYTLGQETEFFLDMREHEDNSWAGGVQPNVEVLYIPILFAIVPLPFPVPWPSISKNSNRLRTAVTNKVMFKTGVLESVEAYDGGSRVTTQHLKWDKMTGKPVLSLVNNNYDAPLYSFTIPAYHEYAAMGPAYRNTGFEYTLSDLQKTPYKEDLYWFTVADGVERYLVPGDELMLSNGDRQVVGTGIYMGTEGGKHTVFSKDNLGEPFYNAYICRSGNRNQLTVDAGTVTALKDPSGPKNTKSYTKTVQIPVSH